MLTQKQIDSLREELKSCKTPLFFFHDDPDGLCSFLLLYRWIKEGKGIIVKAIPKLDSKFIRKVEENSPDKIFVLDIAQVEQEFIDGVKAPVIWIDHHEPLERSNVKYFNPRVKDPKDNTPVTYACWQIAQQDDWIATAGCLGDWHTPDFIKKFIKKYPDLFGEKLPNNLIFETEFGKLVRVFSFILKGRISDVMNCVKILTRIESPYEILRQTTSRGKFIYGKYEHIFRQYSKLIDEAKKIASKDKLLVFTYPSSETSLSADIANELLYLYPDKLIVVGRKKDDEIRMSLRTSKKLLPPMIEKALTIVSGYGGGHENACGACVKERDFGEFLRVLREEFR